MNFFEFLWKYPIYILWLYLAVITLVTFAVFGIDKLKARKGAWRVPEATLMLLCAIGGSIGGLAGMYVFRHKTLHKKFTVGVPVILVIQIAIAVVIVVLTQK